jgi:hypothetical protein
LPQQGWDCKCGSLKLRRLLAAACLPLKSEPPPHSPARSWTWCSPPSTPRWRWSPPSPASSP